MRALDACRDEWHNLVDVQYRQAEEACRGTLIRPDLRFEFRTRFGMSTTAVRRILFCSSAPIADKYASEELRDFWRYQPKVSFAEFAWNSGFRHQFLRIEKRRRDGNRGSRLLAA